MNSKLTVPLLLALLSALFLSGCGGSGDIASLLQKADAQIEAGKLAEAEILLKNALRDDPENPQALALTGKVYKLQGRLRAAYQVLSNVKQLNPTDAESLAALASIELVAGLREDALANARAALELDPSLEGAPLLLAELADNPAKAAQTTQWLSSLPPTAPIHAAIGSLYLKSGNRAVASENFEKAIEIDPNSSPGYAGRFQVLLAQGNQEEAIEAFAKAAEVADPRSGIRLRYVQYLQQSQGDEAARDALDEILSAAPDYLPALSQAAELAAKMGDNKKAKTFVERALKLDPIDPTAMQLKGTLLVLDERTEEAIRHLEKVLELYPNDIKANYQIALAYLANREPAKAKGRLARVVEAVPGHLEATALLSSIQVQEDDHSGAIITLERFLEAKPDSMQGYMLLAEIYNRKGDNAAAAAIYQRLETAQPDNPQLDYLSGLSLLRGQNRTDARSAFESALADDPLHLQSVEQLTALDMGERRFDDALSRIEQTIAASPDTSVLHTIRAQVLHSKGDLEAASDAFEKSIELDSENNTARSLYARLLLQKDEPGNALSQLDAILQNNPEDIGAMTTIASIHESQERFDQAAEQYEQMLEFNPTYLPALNNLAYLYSTKFDKEDRAFELAQKAREQSPNSPYAADTLGWIVYKRGDYRWAKSLLSESHSRLRDNQEVAYHLGSTHYQLGETQAARELLAQATANDPSYFGAEDAEQKLKVLSIDPANATPADTEFLQGITRSAPEDATAQVKLGQIHAAQDRKDDALAAFRDAIRSVPTNLQAQLALGYALLDRQALSEAETLVKDAVSQTPGNPQLVYLQGQVALASGEYTWALSLLRNSYNALPKKPEIAYQLGRAHLQLGHRDAAKRFLGEALASASSFEGREDAQSRMALLEIDTRTVSEDAVSQLESHLSTHENDAQARATLATLHLRSGDKAQAARGFEEALELSPDNVFAKLGQAELLADDPANASRVYSLASEARQHAAEAHRVQALQALSLAQQGKDGLAKSQSDGIDLNQLPADLRQRIEEIRAD